MLFRSRYAIGARVRVQVSRVDLDGRKIDFRIVREAEGERLLNRGRKAESRPGVASAAEQLASVEAQDRDVKRAARKTKAGAGGRTAKKGPAAKTSARGKPVAKRTKR